MGTGFFGDDLPSFRDFAREHIYQFLRDVSMMQYLSFHKGTFPEVRKNSIQVSYCRAHQKIPHSRQINAFDVEALNRALVAFDHVQGVLSASEGARKAREAVLIFLEMHFPIYHMNRLMELLLLLEVPFSVLGFSEREDSTFIMVPVERSEVGVITVVTVLEEWIKARAQPRCVYYRALEQPDTAVYQGLQDMVLRWWNEDEQELIDACVEEFVDAHTEGVLSRLMELGAMPASRRVDFDTLEQSISLVLGLDRERMQTVLDQEGGSTPVRITIYRSTTVPIRIHSSCSCRSSFRIRAVQIFTNQPCSAVARKAGSSISLTKSVPSAT